MKLYFYLFIVFILFSIQIYADTKASMFIADWKKAMTFLFPVVIIFTPVYWFVVKELIKILTNVWLVGIYMTIPITLGVWLGTYLGSKGELPNKMQIIAICINLFAVYISHK